MLTLSCLPRAQGDLNERAREPSVRAAARHRGWLAPGARGRASAVRAGGWLPLLADDGGTSSAGAGRGLVGVVTRTG